MADFPAGKIHHVELVAEKWATTSITSSQNVNMRYGGGSIISREVKKTILDYPSKVIFLY